MVMQENGLLKSYILKFEGEVCSLLTGCRGEERGGGRRENM